MCNCRKLCIIQTIFCALKIYKLKIVPHTLSTTKYLTAMLQCNCSQLKWKFAEPEQITHSSRTL